MSSGATFAIATARSASGATSPAMSLVDTTAVRRPTNTRRPTSSLSERSDCSTAPSRTADRQRHRAHRDRIGGIGAGAARGGHETLGEIRQGGLIEK